MPSSTWPHQRTIDVLANAEAERPTDYFQRRQTGSPDSIVIERNLRRYGLIVLMTLNVDGLVEFKDVGTSRFDGRIARSIRTENDVLAWHMTPPLASFIAEFLCRRLAHKRKTFYCTNKQAFHHSGWREDLLVRESLTRTGLPL